ncbi:MAG: transcription-repair coupling factor, partial [Holosporales bacterium]|nr:transcription-repair coupling factor [Holosporales bacterium]
HPYLPLPPNLLYLSPQELILAFQALERTSAQEECAHARLGEDFILDRQDMGQLITKVIVRLRQERRNGKQLLLTCSTEGGRRRLQQAFAKNLPLTTITTWEEAKEENKQGGFPLVQLPLSAGFTFPDLWVLTEADLWGVRLAHPPLRRRKGRTLGFVDLTAGDYVVHEEHGIGQYKGLQTLAIEGLRHDCLELWYDQGDKLYVPVENFEVVSRYGSEDKSVTLDRLGTLQWQNRKANVKERIGVLAQKLLEVAAQRLLKKSSPLEEVPSEYDLFCARFPYPETEDQRRAIEDVEADFRSGHFADRLICGDVGFGKTEVALRAAFSVVATGRQVVVVVPTTLLCRQHFHTFSERFAGFPPRIAFLSRLTPPKERTEIRKGLAEGTIDIVIGTQALLHNAITFHNLGLLIIDEEQHFGVRQKEQLKALCTEVNVLTLTATPIPRTLQLSLTGVRDLSLIASPPIDRRAVHTFITPFDPVVLREAILRERARHGQVLYVCPRISDLPAIAQFLTDLVPEGHFCLAHGQMPTTQLESTISDFLEGKYDILLATNIIESGIDIPTANTLILHRADLFGLSQLYQLRGRVGRAQAQAYAYFTYEAQHPLPERAKKRLEILERLDYLGAGFTLASFDLDLRGAGNLLGEEQSGHIREVGVELYQNLLQQAVLSLQQNKEYLLEAEGSPQLSLGLSVLIPDTYVQDRATKLDLYRRAADLKNQEERQELEEELCDRFGPLPEEVQNLFTAIRFRNKAKAAYVQRLNLGPKELLLTFRAFPNPEALLKFISQSKGRLRLYPGDKISLYFAKNRSLSERLHESEQFLDIIIKIAQRIAEKS